MATMSEAPVRSCVGAWRRQGVSACCWALVFVSCPRSYSQSHPTPSPSVSLASSPDPGPVQAAPLLLGSGDLLEVQVFSTPDLSGKARVDQYGLLNLPVIGAVHVTGLTAAQVAVAIEQRLKTGLIMLDPHVTVFVDEYASQSVNVLGEVKKVGPVPLYGAQSLYDVLSEAGGLGAGAGGTISISHRNDPSPPVNIQVNTPNYSSLAHTTQINPGDTIVVSQADLIYVVGDLQRQGSIPIVNGVPLTILNVLSLSSGMTPTAAGSKASIVRETPTGVTTIHLNLHRILKQEDPNIVMQAKDILVVPRSIGKEFLTLALPQVTSAVVSSAVYSALNR